VLFAGQARAQYNVSQPVILQDFNSSYLSIENKMPDIFASGYGAVYLPPPGYSTTTNSVGYDVYNRFDLGTAQQPTTYGTQAEFQSVINGVHSFGGKGYIDLLWNDSSALDANTPGFAASGGFPGLAVVLQNTNPNAPGYNTLGYNQNGTSSGVSYQDGGKTYYYAGDYHDPSEPSNGIDGQVAGLDDIAQEENIRLIRQPTTAGNPQNIPAGTMPWNGYLANVPNPANAQYYPDLSLTPKTFYDQNLKQNFTVYQYNTSNPMAGTPVAENATGYLMRYTQWMVQQMGVDGFRIDAALNMPTWALDYYDAAVYDESNRKLLNGAQEQVYGYSEIYYGTTGTDAAYINLSDNNYGASSTIEPNRDAMDFPLYQAMYNNLNAFNGQWGKGSSSWYNVVTSSLDYADNGLLDGSQGVKFVNDQDGGVPAPGLQQVAYAYMLMLPGQAEVYFNGENINNESGSGSSGYFPEGGANDPKDAALGALGGVFNTNVQNSAYSNLNITNLVDIRNRYGRGNYRQDWIEQNLLAYERSNSALVLLSNATSIDSNLAAGTDVETRTMSVTFAPGTWLEELTGNATSSYADPNGEVPQFVQVQSGGQIPGGGQVTVKFLGNLVYSKGSTTNSYATNDGFLIYGLPTPTGTMSMTNVASVMGSQTGKSTTPGGWEPNANWSNGVDRNVAVNVVTAASFTISLNTVEANLQVSPTQVYHDQNADGDNAQFSIDGGAVTVAANGVTSTTPGSNGEVTTPGNVSYGYQNFANSSPGYNNANGNGAYSQVVDTANLSIGYHYIEMIAFRHNSDPNAPPVYNDWHQTIYVDRGTPSASIQSFQPFTYAPTTYENRQLDIQGDGTTTSEYVFLNLPAGITNAQILNMINTGSNTINGVNYQGGLAGQTDQTIFAYGFNGLQNGNNVATVVSYRPDGNESIQRFTASQVPDLGHSTLNGLGLGDLNADGHINNTDVQAFATVVESNGQSFNPSADMTGQGVNDANDWLLFAQELQQNNQLGTSNPDYVSANTLSYFNSVSPTVPVNVAAGTSYNLQVPINTASMGTAVLGVGSSLNVTGTGNAVNVPYTLSLSGASIAGAVSINVANNGSGAGTLNIGTITDNGNPSTLNFGGNGTINVTGGGSLVAASTVFIPSGTTVVLAANSALGYKGASIVNNGALTINGNQIIGNLAGTGSLAIGNGSAKNVVQFATNSGGSSVNSLVINGLSSLDLNNNHIIINYGTGSDPIATIKQYLINGYNGGSQFGADGIYSSAAANNLNYGLGYADGADGVVSGLQPGQIEIAYTLLGDVNLDGKVNGADFAILAANFNKAANGWDQGDFNFDGSVNGADFAVLAENFNQGASGASVMSAADPAVSTPGSDVAAMQAFAASNGFQINVPEPASLACLALGLIGALYRGRRASGNRAETAKAGMGHRAVSGNTPQRADRHSGNEHLGRLL
jgi:hypothetical protein